MSQGWSCRDSRQHLQVEDAVLAHMIKHRQLTSRASEAGGQLFGVVSDEDVRVLRATGPYAGDERNRYHYRSNPTAAQQAIEGQTKTGLLYLGEWHTHAEDHPRASWQDAAAMKALHAGSRLNTTSMLLMIVGRGQLPDGLYVCSFDGRRLVEWFQGNPPESRLRRVLGTMRNAFR